MWTDRIEAKLRQIKGRKAAGSGNTGLYDRADGDAAAAAAAAVYEIVPMRTRLKQAKAAASTDRPTEDAKDERERREN